MTGFNGMGGGACDASGGVVAVISCRCANGSEPPATVEDLTSCCTACSTEASRAETVTFNAVRESCPAPPSGDEPAEEVPTFRSPSSFGYRNPLGGDDIPTIIGRVVRTAIGIMGALFLAAFIYGGIMWMTAGGEMERVAKAKKTLANAVIGLLIVGFSYAILSALFGTLGRLG